MMQTIIMGGLMMARNRAYAITVAIFLMGSLLVPVRGHAYVDFTFMGTQSVYWSNPLNWHPEFRYPNNSFDRVSLGVACVLDVTVQVNRICCGNLGIQTGQKLTLSYDSNGDYSPETYNCHVLVEPGAQLVAGHDLVPLITSTVELAGGNLGGNTFVNDTSSTIRGGGGISAHVQNHGTILADNGTLILGTVLNTYFTNDGGIMSASGGVLDIRRNVTGGTIQAVDGGIAVLNGSAILQNTSLAAGTAIVTGPCTLSTGNAIASGAEIQVNNGETLDLINTPTITNNGIIRLNSSGDLTQLRSDNHTATLTGTGKVVLGVDLNNGLTQTAGGGFVNDTYHTIEGSGSISAALINQGTILANTGILRINQNIAGTGTISVGDGATFSVGDRSGMLETGNFFMSQDATLEVTSGKWIYVKKDFLFSQKEQSKWIWPNAYLGFTGGGTKQRLEIGGSDGDGFANNFGLTSLVISENGTYVFLTDGIDNGHRSAGAREVLYTNQLRVDPGTTLNLNRLKLYTYLNKTIHQVRAGEGNLFGGGKIIDVSESPGPRNTPALLSPLLSE
jgi:hypothetical protein